MQQSTLGQADVADHQDRGKSGEHNPQDRRPPFGLEIAVRRGAKKLPESQKSPHNSGELYK